MEGASCFDALQPFLVRFRVLAQLSPGDIVGIDESGHWYLTAASPWRSGLRHLWAFITREKKRPQRDTFLVAARETITLVCRHVTLLLKTMIFQKSLNANGKMSMAIVAQLSPTEKEEIESIVHTLQSVCGHFYDGLKGIYVMKNNAPYSTDLTFCSELDVTLQDPILQFLDTIHRKIGDYEPQVFNFLLKNHQHKQAMILKNVGVQQAQPNTQPTPTPMTYQHQWTPASATSTVTSNNNNTIEGKLMAAPQKNTPVTTPLVDNGTNNNNLPRTLSYGTMGNNKLNNMTTSVSDLKSSK